MEKWEAVDDGLGFSLQRDGRVVADILDSSNTAEEIARKLNAFDDMLEALKAARIGLESAMTHLHANGVKVGAIEHAHRLVIAAISKAEGRTC